MPKSDFKIFKSKKCDTVTLFYTLTHLHIHLHTYTLLNQLGFFDGHSRNQETELGKCKGIA